MAEFSIIIPTFGNRMIWDPLAERAEKSAKKQRHSEVIRSHADTLQHARNEGAEQAKGNYLIFLDADDELAPGYVSAIESKLGQGDIYRPSTLGFYPDGTEDNEPVLIPRRIDILTGNFIVIGAAISRDLFIMSGGFDSLDCLEDWDLFLNLIINHDATVVDVPDAIYRVMIREDSRNQDVARHAAAYTTIRAKYGNAKYV